MAETLLCLGTRVIWLSLFFFFFCLVKEKKKAFMFPLPFFFSLQVTMSQDRVVTCFHEYVMKKKEVRNISTLYHSNSKSSSKV